ncbi:adhesin [Hyalangium rubrum]|uniref:Adhesin n=1 Tax=Hyalangium rubrum TaxID=3103134 RepID=A0ABU5GVK9_9BACT|nr:adhesin [Hyalangium sp. s54d21]MDY7225216.1 adhesin [Hyalangium sp. s54d21]
MNRLQWTVVLAWVAISATAWADEYPYLGHKMLNTRENPFSYYVDSRNQTPAGISLSSVIQATQDAFQAWENVGCAYPDFNYAGLTSQNTSINPNDVGNAFDAFNVSTVWVTSNTDPYYELALGRGQAKTGSIPLTYAGYLYQCDIFVNAVNYLWTVVPNTDPSGGRTDLQSALTHEIGHCLGLDDVYSPTEAVMHAVLPAGGNRRALDVHDEEHLCRQYPDNGAVGSPCSPSDPCSNGLNCIPYNKSDGGLLYRYCTKNCALNNPGDCPDPFVCRRSLQDGGTACTAVPNEAITQVGKPCGVNGDCGSAVGLCQNELALPSTGIAWEDGYCQESCSLAPNDNCPAGSLCTATGNGNRCLKSCRVGSGDCRVGYTCSPLPTGNVCVPNCYTDSDCNVGSSSPTAFSCRVCDRICFANTGLGRSVGSPCNQTSECSAGQVCLFINNQPTGVCSQPCSNAACGCPGGSTCRAVGNVRMCMRDCSAGTCEQPLACNPLGDGFACQPGCQNNLDCPSGYFCSGGGCFDPYAPTDGGCTLCGNDAGTQPPPPPPPTDGGSGGGGTPDGCGCSGGPASALVFLAALVLLLGVGGRRSWQRR